jgi:NADH dehydrogenase
MTNKRVESEDDDSIIISGKDIPSKTVVWTSGVTNNPFFTEHTDIFPAAKNGRIDVDEHLKVDNRIYVIGDNANTPYTGLAQTAIYDGLYVAKAIRAEARKQALPDYKPRSQPVVIPVGDNWAILEYGPIRITGFLGSLIHKAAGLIGYLDYFPIGKAMSLWGSENQLVEECSACQ